MPAFMRDGKPLSINVLGIVHENAVPAEGCWIVNPEMFEFSSLLRKT